MAEEKASNWHKYFEHIRKQCPWSWAAWQKGQIEICEWHGHWLHLGEYEARVYVTDLNRRRLKKLCGKLDVSEEYEWLWSEPRYGKYASPVPILIQQYRAKLEEIRHGNIL